MSDETCADDELFVCGACGKTSTTKYGISGKRSPGWDESCMMNSEKHKKTQLHFTLSGRVDHIGPVPRSTK